MSTVTRTAPFVVALLLALAAARPAAADGKASVEQLKALNQSAQSAYADGEALRPLPPRATPKRRRTNYRKR